MTALNTSQFSYELRNSPAARELAYPPSGGGIQPPTFYPAGAEIYAQGETCGSLYKIEFGAERIYRLLSDGRRQISHFTSPVKYSASRLTRSIISSPKRSAVPASGPCVQRLPRAIARSSFCRWRSEASYGRRSISLCSAAKTPSSALLPSSLKCPKDRADCGS